MPDADVPRKSPYKQVEIELPTGESKSFVAQMTWGEMRTFAEWDGTHAHGLWLDLASKQLGFESSQMEDWPESFWPKYAQIILKHNLAKDYEEVSLEMGATLLRDSGQEILQMLTETAHDFVKEHGAQLQGLANVFAKVQEDMARVFTPVASAYRALELSVPSSTPGDTEASATASEYFVPGMAELKALYSIEHRIQVGNEMQRKSGESNEQWSLVISILTVGVGIITVVSSLPWRIGILAVAVASAIAIRWRHSRKRKP